MHDMLSPSTTCSTPFLDPCSRGLDRHMVRHRQPVSGQACCTDGGTSPITTQTLGNAAVAVSKPDSFVKAGSSKLMNHSAFAMLVSS